MTPITTNPHTIAQAGRALGHWLIKQAHHTGRVLGFSYAPSSEAPSTFEGVKAEYRDCLMRRRAFRVWDGGSDATVYAQAEANYAFRFLHDIQHVHTGGDFTPQGEARVALAASRKVIAHFGDSLETRLFLADSLGQVHYHAQTGGAFPEDQALFVTFVVMRGEGLGLHGFTQALPGLVAQFLHTMRPALAH